MRVMRVGCLCFVYALGWCEHEHFIFQDTGRTILCFMTPQSTQCLLQVHTRRTTDCTPKLSCCVWLRFMLTLLLRLEASSMSPFRSSSAKADDDHTAGTAAGSLNLSP